jgi:tRNA 2-thiouridine synthesizing protein A
MPQEVAGSRHAMTDAKRFDVFLDARGLDCPLPLIKARQALMVVDSGASICVLSTDPGSRGDFERFCEATGHHLLSVEQKEEVLILVVRKA